MLTGPMGSMGEDEGFEGFGSFFVSFVCFCKIHSCIHYFSCKGYFLTGPYRSVVCILDFRAMTIRWLVVSLVLLHSRSSAMNTGFRKKETSRFPLPKESNDDHNAQAMTAQVEPCWRCSSQCQWLSGKRTCSP